MIYVRILQFLFAILITLLQTLLFHKTVGLKPKWQGSRLALVMIAFSAIEGVLQLYFASASKVAGIVILLLYILYPVILMGGRIKERFFFGVINVTIFYFSAVLRVLIVYAVTAKQTATTFVGTFVSLLLQLIIYSLLALLVLHLSTEGKRYISNTYWYVMSIGFVGILVTLVLADSYNSAQTYEELFAFLSKATAILLTFWLLLYFIFYFVSRYFAKTIEAQTLLIQKNVIERYVLRKQASDHKIKILSHDLRHSLAQWRTLAEEKGDLTALQRIDEYERELDSSLLINLENDTANAVINQKFWEAQQLEIDFVVEGVFHAGLSVSNLDLCSLLGNLLDNALEAASKVNNKELRRVKLTVRRQQNLLILLVENGYEIEPVMEQGLFRTSKKASGLHAIGTQSIRYVAQKYQGVVNNNYKNNWFTAAVLINGYSTIDLYKNEAALEA